MLGKTIGKWLPMMAAGLIFLSGCAPVVKENGKTMPRIDGEAKIEWNRAKYPLAVETLNSHGEKERQVFYSPPKRVAAVWQNSIETLLALGVGDRIIAGMGVPDGKYIREEYRADYEAIPYKSLENLDTETIMMMKPDFIAGWSSTFSAKVLRGTEFWNERGVHTYISQNSNPENRNRTIENEYDDILNMGKIFDREEKAKSLVKEMKDEISRAAGQANLTGKHPSGLIIEFMGSDISVYGEETLAGDILRRMSGKLLAPGQQQISKEQIIEMDPDAIFVVLIEEDYDYPGQKLDMLYNEQALRDVRCIREKRVYPLPLYSVYSSGIRTLDGIRYIGKGLYPDLYKEQ